MMGALLPQYVCIETKVDRQYGNLYASKIYIAK